MTTWQKLGFWSIFTGVCCVIAGFFWLLAFLTGWWFAFGMMGGAAVTWYFVGVRLGLEENAQMDKAMTDLMNMVPKENRFGYDADFPEGTKWEH